MPSPASDGTGLPVLGRCVGHGAFPVFNNSGDYTKQQASPGACKRPPGLPSGYVQTSDDGLVYSSGYAMLTLGELGGKAEYYQVKFDGDISAATSKLLWTDTIPGSGAAASEPGPVEPRRPAVHCRWVLRTRVANRGSLNHWRVDWLLEAASGWSS